MNDLILISNWLKDQNRKFSDGIAIRNKYKINAKMDAFFAKADPDNPDSVTRNMLMQEVSKIHIKLMQNPRLIEEKAAQQIIAEKPIKTSQTPSKRAKVQIETSKLKEEDIPEELKPDFKRIQEIMPEIGAVHAKLKATDDSEESKLLAEQVVSLDSEKRELWAKIDKYFASQGKQIVDDVPKAEDEKVLTPFEKAMAIEDPQQRLIALTKREKMVTDDIARSKVKLEDFKNNKPHLVKEKEAAIAGKEQELKNIQDARAAIEGAE